MYVCNKVIKQRRRKLSCDGRGAWGLKVGDGGRMKINDN